MSKVAKKTYVFQSDALDAVSFRVYYKKTADGVLDYDSPFVTIPAASPAAGTYSVKIPDQVPIAEGEYCLGASAIDATGNESDIGALVTYPFDFTVPTTPYNGRVV